MRSAITRRGGGGARAATTFSKLDEEVEILRALNLPQSRLVHSEICIHFQNAKLSSSHIPHPTVDTALPAYDRDREEMEILKRYIRRETMNLYQYIIIIIIIRRENPGAEYLCNCAKSTLDFNCRFVYDSKVRF